MKDIDSRLDDELKDNTLQEQYDYSVKAITGSFSDLAVKDSSNFYKWSKKRIRKIFSPN